MCTSLAHVGNREHINDEFSFLACAGKPASLCNCRWIIELQQLYGL